MDTSMTRGATIATGIITATLRRIWSAITANIDIMAMTDMIDRETDTIDRRASIDTIAVAIAIDKSLRITGVAEIRGGCRRGFEGPSTRVVLLPQADLPMWVIQSAADHDFGARLIARARSHETSAIGSQSNGICNGSVPGSSAKQKYRSSTFGATWRRGSFRISMGCP